MASHHNRPSHSCQPPPLGLDGVSPWPGPIHRQPPGSLPAQVWPPTTIPHKDGGDNSKRASHSKPDSPGASKPYPPTAFRKAASVKSAGSSSSRKNIAASFKGFFHSLRPSNCPEQGFTLRHHNHEHQTIDEVLMRKRSSSVMQPRTTNVQKLFRPRRKSEGSDEPAVRHYTPSTPDTIVSEAWNIPVPLPRRASNGPGKPKVKATPLPVRKIKSRLDTGSDDSHSVIHHRADDTISSLDGTWVNMRERRAKSGNIPAISMPSRKPVPPQNHSSLPIPSQAHGSPTSSYNLMSSVMPGYDKARELFMAKQEARRQRRILREASDYLGVTGANPYTGMLDNITPRTSVDMNEFRRVSPQSSPPSVKNGHDTGKQASPRQRSKLGQGEQWSSAASPSLSPIVQSQSPSIKGVEPAQAGQQATISHTSKSFLGMGTVVMRLGPGPMDTGPVQVQTGIKKPFSKIPIPDRRPIPRKMLPGTPRTPVPSSGEVTHPHLDLANLNPARQWANMLIEDLGGLERSIRDSTREAKAWANSVAQDISGLGQALHLPQLQSASTPTITTTGCASSPRQQLPSAIKESSAKGPEAKTFPKTRKASGVKAPKKVQKMTEPVTAPSLHQISSLSSSALPKSDSLMLPDSPPSTLPNDSQNVAKPEVHPHHSSTASLAADRVVKVMGEDLPDRVMRKTMRKEPEIQDATNDKRLSSLTSTYMCRLRSVKSKSWSANQGPANVKSFTQAMAQGAARAAFMQHPADQRAKPESIPASASRSDSAPKSQHHQHGRQEAATPTGRVRTGETKAGVEETAAAKSVMKTELGVAPVTSIVPKETKKCHKLKYSADHGGGDIESRSRSQESKSQPQTTGQPHPPGAAASDDLYRLFPGLALPVRSMLAAGWGEQGFEVPVGVRIVVSVVVTFVGQFVCAYWVFVRPVFRLDSPLHKRYAQGQSTLGDVVVYIFAFLFVFLGTAAVLWTIRGIILVCVLGRAIIGGLAMLAGL
ncbi:hypothetical protein B0T20DRAFT_437794 [Sordaria brevicollis]|uniref:Uncharacterized protein n=1 Tax=Sordaria brevicollis TaxID=83679 RepID=A0AAE0UCN2_SORBR|nr:hypothetical protein B0T20DRAFT_437794 [Sordaria brevicollis]